MFLIKIIHKLLVKKHVVVVGCYGDVGILCLYIKNSVHVLKFHMSSVY